MKYFTTLSDYKFLPLGLSLYESLLNTSKEKFELYYLCLDEETFLKISNIELDNIIPISMEDLYKDNQDILNFKYKYYKEFIWMLASYFTNWIMMNYNPKSISYIDADIYFYDDIQIMYEEIENKSIGIIKHRQYPDNYDPFEGKYNVGVVYFKNDIIGKECLNWWKDSVINRKYKKLSKCYDQKYLDEFPVMYPSNTCIANEGFAYSAPWHHHLYNWDSWDKNNKIYYQGKEQILLFNHFSRIEFNIEEDTYIPSGNKFSEWTNNSEVFEIINVRRLHDNYFNIIKHIYNKYNI